MRIKGAIIRTSCISFIVQRLLFLIFTNLVVDLPLDLLNSLPFFRWEMRIDSILSACSNPIYKLLRVLSEPSCGGVLRLLRCEVWRVIVFARSAVWVLIVYAVVLEALFSFTCRYSFAYDVIVVFYLQRMDYFCIISCKFWTKMILFYYPCHSRLIVNHGFKKVVEGLSLLSVFVESWQNHV